MRRDVTRALNQAERSAKINPKIDTSQFGREADRAGRNFASRFETASGRSAGAAGRSAAGAFVGGFAGLLATGGLAAAADTAIGQFKDMVNTGLDFSKTMNNFQGVTRASEFDLKRMSQAARALGGFRELFRQLDEAKKRMTPEQFQAQSNILFGSDAMRGAMLGTVEDFDKMHDAIMRSGSASEMAEAQMKGLPGAIESMKNATESIQLSAFEAIGPALTTGVSQFVLYVEGHKPELIGTFSMMAQAALGLGEAVGGVSAGIITAFAAITGGIGNSLGTLARGIAKIAEFTGADGTAKDFNEFADSAYGWGESLYTAGDVAMDMVGKMGNLRESIAAASDGIIAKEQLLRGLGKATLEVFRGREIVIKNNTPEVTANLKAMGNEIREMPDGQFEVIPLTDAAKAVMDQVRRDWTAPMKPEFDVDPAKAKATLDRLLSEYPQFTGAGSLMTPTVALPGPPVSAPSTPAPSTLGPLDLLVPKRERGGIFDVWTSISSFADGKLSRQALIQPPVAGAGLVQWAEPSTGGEAFIPIDGGDRSRSIWAETGRLLGVFEQGGIRGGDGLAPNAEQARRLIMQAFPQIQDSGGWRPPDGFNEHSSGQALDVMIPNPGTPEGKALGSRINQWLIQNADALGIQYDLWQQAQWNPDGTTSGMENRGGATANHMDHVHVRVKGGEATGAALNSLYAAGDGGYEVDQQSVFDAETRAIKARNDLAVQRKQLAELEAKGTATESQLMAARNDVAEQERDVQSAESKLTEVKRGKLKNAQSGSDSSGGQSSVQSFASGIFGGFMESRGLPGFSDALSLPLVKSGQAALNAFAGPLKGAMEGKLGIQQAGWSPGMPIGEEGNVVPLPGGGGGGIPGIGLPGMGDFLRPMPDGGLRQPKDHLGYGAGPGPGNTVTTNYNINGGCDAQAAFAAARKKENASWRSSGMAATRPV